MNKENNRQTISGLNDYALSACNCDKEKILKTVEECVSAMSRLTITESKVARKHLDYIMENMYKHSPDTLIGAIRPRR